MTAQPVEARRVKALDPASPEGIAAADRLAVIHAGVINRLRREGLPVPGDQPTDPSP